MTAEAPESQIRRCSSRGRQKTKYQVSTYTVHLVSVVDLTNHVLVDDDSRDPVAAQGRQDKLLGDAQQHRPPELSLGGGKRHEGTTVASDADGGRWRHDGDRHEEGVMPKPPDPHAPGEMGKPVKVEKPDPEVKKLIDDGWQKNAFNQYVSDMISVHRSLPDPRDEW